MTVRRYQLVTRPARRRLVLAAGAYLVERAAWRVQDYTPETDVSRLANGVSARLYEVGIRNATALNLATLAECLHARDALASGEADVEAWLEVDGVRISDREHARDMLIAGFDGDVEYCLDLAVIPV